MILIVTNRADYTADFLILDLKRRGIDFVRFNTEEFPQSVGLSIFLGNGDPNGCLKISGRTISIGDIQSVWYRRPVASEPTQQIADVAAQEFIATESRETLGGLWRLLPCLWVNHPDKLRVAESKLYQLSLAAHLGFVVPQTLVTNVPDDAESFYDNRPGQIVYKPQHRGEILRENTTNLIYTNVVGDKQAAQLDGVRFAPALLQHYVPKKVEIRATVVGDKVFAVELHSQQLEQARHDWRRADPHQLRHTPCQLPLDTSQKCVQLVRSLGLVFGAIDLIQTPDDKYVFLEINPNGQWAWIEQICPEVHIRDALVNALVNAGLETS